VRFPLKSQSQHNSTKWQVSALSRPTTPFRRHEFLTHSKMNKRS